MSLFLLRPVMTTLLILIIAIGGFFAFLKIPLHDIPSVEKPIIQIDTAYKGANPQVVLNQVTVPLEKELLHVPGVTNMASYSQPEASEIRLTFDLAANMDEALKKVQAAVRKAETEFGSDIGRPSFSIEEGGSELVLYLILTTDDPELAEELVIPKLNRIQGIAKVKTFGPKTSLWLKIDPEVLAAKQIGFNQIVNALKEHLAEKPLGVIKKENQKLYLELAGNEEDEKSLGNLLIDHVRLKELGEFALEAQDGVKVSFEGKPSLLLGLQKIRGADTVAISNQVKKVLAELPPSIQLKVWFDKAIWIKQAIHELEWTFLFSAFLVVLVLYLYLKTVKESFIPALALPLSILGTIGILFLAHFSLNLLSLLALTLSIGFVVDDAIVVSENILRHRSLGLSPLEASLKGTKEIVFTVLSITLSLIAVFIPLLFMGGVNGRLFREFSITLALAVTVSGLIALSAIPLLASKWLKLTTPKQTSHPIYSKLLKISFCHPLPILMFALAATGAVFYAFPKLPLQLFPDEDRGFIIASVQSPPQVKLDEEILKNPNVQDLVEMRFEDRTLLFIRLKEKREEQKLVIQALERSLHQIPAVLAHFSGYQMLQIDFDWGTPGRYQYTLQGKDFAEVEEAIDSLEQILRTSPYVKAVKTGQKRAKLELALDQIEPYGITKQEVQETLKLAYGKMPIGHLKQKTPILMDIASSDLPKIPIKAKNGSSLPLKALVSWKETVGPSALVQINHRPASTLRFSLKEGSPPSVGIKEVETIAKTLLPDSIQGAFSGYAEIIQSSKKEWALLLLFASLAMYVVLAILYESFIHPLTILSSLPLATLGGILTLFLFSEPLSLFSAVGFLLLIGIVKKNGIMIVDYALKKQKQGLPPEKAIHEGCLVRFRPIMMTTAAAIMGALPLTFGTLYRGLGLVIVGGLIFSQLFTLFITPILYLYFEKLKKKFSGRNCW